MKKIISLLACLFIGSANAGIISASDVVVDQEIHDYYFSTLSTGIVNISVIESIVDSSDFDSEINLFSDDGSLDLLDFLANDDDGGTGLESFISMTLGAGDYLLRIGTHNFGNSSGTDAVIIAATNSGGHHSYTDYDLTISGDHVTSNAVPEPSVMALFACAIAGLRLSRKKEST